MCMEVTGQELKTTQELATTIVPETTQEEDMTSHVSCKGGKFSAGVLPTMLPKKDGYSI